MLKNDILLVLPEIILLSMACLGLVVDLFLSNRIKQVSYWFSQLTLLVVAYFCVLGPQAETQSAFGGQFSADPMAQILKLFILLIMLLVFMYSRSYASARKLPNAEFYTLSLFSTLGMLILVSSKNLLLLYLGLELLSLPLYALVSLQRNSAKAIEAGMKYFVMGALASGMLLYGMSLLYGLTGSIQLNEISQFLQLQDSFQMLGIFALVFIVVGLAFKLGAVPFHMWVPDVYQGAPTNVTLLIGSASKLAAFGMAFRLLHDGLQPAWMHWSQFFIVIAILSMAVGNIVAIVQTDIKRLLGYSAIAHMGFVFLGLSVAPIPGIGYAPALYYMAVYALVTTAAFGVVLYVSHGEVECQTLSDLKGLSQRNPWLALILLLAAFSLAGVPPMVGFYAKFIILSALVDAGLTWLAVVAVIFSIIGAFYYLKIVRLMYFDKADSTAVIKGDRDFYAALTLNGAGILLLGVFPAPLYVFCQSVLV